MYIYIYTRLTVDVYSTTWSRNLNRGGELGKAVHSICLRLSGSAGWLERPVWATVPGCLYHVIGYSLKIGAIENYWSNFLTLSASKGPKKPVTAMAVPCAESTFQLLFPLLCQTYKRSRNTKINIPIYFSVARNRHVAQAITSWDGHLAEKGITSEVMWHWPVAQMRQEPLSPLKHQIPSRSQIETLQQIRVVSWPW